MLMGYGNLGLSNRRRVCNFIFIIFHRSYEKKTLDIHLAGRRTTPRDFRSPRNECKRERRAGGSEALVKLTCIPANAPHPSRNVIVRVCVCMMYAGGGWAKNILLLTC